VTPETTSCLSHDVLALDEDLLIAGSKHDPRFMMSQRSGGVIVAASTSDKASVPGRGREVKSGRVSRWAHHPGDNTKLPHIF